MNTLNWKFTKFLLDLSDIEAQHQCSQDLFDLLTRNPMRMNESEMDIFLFNCGFNRGAAWMDHKIRRSVDAPERAQLLDALRVAEKYITTLRQKLYTNAPGMQEIIEEELKQDCDKWMKVKGEYNI